MRRSDRLFAIIQMLRGRRRPLTAQRLADELEVGVRTIYRDMAELTAQRVPVRGEAGTGYVIDAGYDLPPLMLTPDELEAALLGAAWVAQRGDTALARGARSLIDKLSESLPKHLRLELIDAHVRPAPARSPLPDGVDIAPIRGAIRTRAKVEIAYLDNAGKTQASASEPLRQPRVLAVGMNYGCALRASGCPRCRMSCASYSPAIHRF